MRRFLRWIAWKMRRLLRWVVWKWNAEPYIEYPGFHCGLCGKWVGKPFKVPDYQSVGEWGDTWGICDDCGTENN